jgi:hypothetical protein
LLLSESISQVELKSHTKRGDVITTIMDMLCMTLGNYFPNINIYTEQVGQGFLRPAFFVWQERQKQEQEIGNRFHRVHEIRLSYFPDVSEGEDVYEELWGVGDDLTALLQLLEHNGELLHGRDMSMEIKDSVLHFSVSYGEYLCLAESGTKMNKIKMNGVID